MTFRGAAQPRKNRLGRGRSSSESRRRSSGASRRRSSGASRGRSSGPRGVAHRGLSGSLVGGSRRRSSGPSRGCLAGALSGYFVDVSECPKTASRPLNQSKLSDVSATNDWSMTTVRLTFGTRMAVPRSSPALGSLSVGKRSRLEPRRPMPKALQLVAEADGVKSQHNISIET